MKMTEKKIGVLYVTRVDKTVNLPVVIEEIGVTNVSVLNPKKLLCIYLEREIMSHTPHYHAENLLQPTLGIPSDYGKVSSEFVQNTWAMTVNRTDYIYTLRVHDDDVAKRVRELIIPEFEQARREKSLAAVLNASDAADQVTIVKDVSVDDIDREINKKMIEMVELIGDLDAYESRITVSGTRGVSQVTVGKTKITGGTRAPGKR